MQLETKKFNGLFGLRLSHSLHLGHLVGNVRPALSDEKDRLIIVVLADLFTYTSDRKHDITLDNILAMTTEVMSLGLHSKNIKFVIQSKAFPNLIQLFSVLSCLVKFDKLKNTKPISKHFEKGSDFKFSDITFPIIQCAEMLSTNSEILYSNIDNLGIVSLTKDLYKKFGNYSNNNIPKPHLNYGLFPNVLGTDYKKMSYSRKNAIFIEDTEEIIKKKITSINTAINNKENIDISLLIQYFKILGYSEEDTQEIVSDMLKNKTTPQKIKLKLSSELFIYFKNIKEEKKQYLLEKEKIIERINSDTIFVNDLVEINTKKIFQNIYSSEFYNQFNF